MPVQRSRFMPSRLLYAAGRTLILLTGRTIVLLYLVSRSSPHAKAIPLLSSPNDQMGHSRRSDAELELDKAEVRVAPRETNEREDTLRQSLHRLQGASNTQHQASVSPHGLSLLRLPLHQLGPVAINPKTPFQHASVKS